MGGVGKSKSREEKSKAKSPGKQKEHDSLVECEVERGCRYDHGNYGEGSDGSYIRFNVVGYKAYVDEDDRCAKCSQEYKMFNDKNHPVVCKSFNDEDSDCRHSLCSACYGKEVEKLGGKGRKRRQKCLD